MASFKKWLYTPQINEIVYYFDQNTTIEEAVNTSRYSVEINFRSRKEEVLEAFAKISLGYVSAALKQDQYHIKHVFEDFPIRILISTRNWDDGEWVCVVSFNKENECFVISKGFYNKDKRTVSIQSNNRCSGSSAADITKEVRNIMHQLKHTADKHLEKLKPALMKRGPKR